MSPFRNVCGAVLMLALGGLTPGAAEYQGLRRLQSTDPPTNSPSQMPSLAAVTTDAPTKVPVTDAPTAPPTKAPVTDAPSIAPVAATTTAPTITATTVAPVTTAPTKAPVLEATGAPSAAPFTAAPTVGVDSSPPFTASPTSGPPTTSAPTSAPTPMTTETPTPAPTPSPTVAPTTGKPTTPPLTAVPSAFPTQSPTTPPLTAVPSASPSTTPSAEPQTETPTAPVTAATLAPTKGPQTDTAAGLKQTLVGMTTCDTACSDAWIAQMSTFTRDFYAESSTVSLLSNIPVISEVQEPTGGTRRLQQGVTIVYDHTFEYEAPADGSDVQVLELAEGPFVAEADREQFTQDLKEFNEGFTDLEGVTSIDIPETSSPTGVPTAAPSKKPTDDDGDKPFYEEWGLSQGAFIGICAGAGVFIIACLGCFCMSKKSKTDEGYQNGQEPPDVVKAKQGGDEVSTMGGPQNKLYGDQSVATVDYDYSKAYGGGGDTSVSEAGGTYGSNTQGLVDPANAAATGGALGGFEGGGSFEDAYRGAGGNVKEELIHVFAPPGKLGVVIDTPDDGAPVVHAVKDSSVIADKIQVGDKLVAVDDEDVRAMTAIKVSKLISRKSANPSRKLSIIRTTVIE